MDYNKIYHDLVDNCRHRSLVRGIKGYELHHVLPRSLGGDDECYNLVRFTYREHFIAHKLLIKMCKGGDRYKMITALLLMSTSGKHNTSYAYALHKSVNVPYYRYYSHDLPKGIIQTSLGHTKSTIFKEDFRLDIESIFNQRYSKLKLKGFASVMKMMGSVVAQGYTKFSVPFSTDKMTSSQKLFLTKLTETGIIVNLNLGKKFPNCFEIIDTSLIKRHAYRDLTGQALGTYVDNKMKKGLCKALVEGKHLYVLQLKGEKKYRITPRIVGDTRFKDNEVFEKYLLCKLGHNELLNAVQTILKEFNRLYPED